MVGIAQQLECQPVLIPGLRAHVHSPAHLSHIDVSSPPLPPLSLKINGRNILRGELTKKYVYKKEKYIYGLHSISAG